MEVFRECYLPYYQRANNWIHEHTDWKILKHNCGAVRPLIPLLIESGFDALNPVQTSADHMDPQELKDEFGKDGGFVFNSVHIIQANTPIENIVAMIDAVKEFNGDK